MSEILNMLLPSIIVMAAGAFLIILVSKIISSNKKASQMFVYIRRILYLIILLFIFPNLFFIILLLIIIYIMYIIAKKVVNKSNKKYKKEIFNLQYFRDDLDKINPNYISFLLNYDIEYIKDLNAIILKLLNDGYISENNGIFKCTDKKTNNIPYSEQYLIMQLVNNSLNYKSYIEYKNYILNELIKLEYILVDYKYTKKNSIKQFLKNIAVYSLIIIFGIIIVAVLLQTGYTDTLLTMIISIITIIMIFAFGLFLIFNIIYILNLSAYPYKRTKKANILLDKAYALKRFMEDFSILDERQQKELVNWEYYMIYAVTFGINKNIDNNTIKNYIMNSTLQ